MKRNIIIFAIFTLVLLLLLTGCSSKHSENTILQISGSYSIPGMFQADLKENLPIEVLQKDSYGRILYSYSSYNVITETTEIAVAICQKSDDEFVYFYEDVCYIIGNYTDIEIEILKNINDWDLPYDENKMSRRKIQYSIDRFIISETNQDIYKIRRLFANNINVKPSDIYDHSLIDSDGHGMDVYLFSVISPSGEKKQYYVMSNESYQLNYVEILEIDDLIQFKKDNNWTYGY